jgi:crotonobetainyl-CoA:carnitine CoA-transferase CaiB-like acyl-CoA transferase
VSTPQPSVGQPFAGLKVLDFSWVVIGPMATRYLSDFGATVVRVESAKRPDVIRDGPPFAEGKPGINRSGYWSTYNSGKLGLALDMGDERGRALAFVAATEWADIVAENFTPGVMEKWGLSYEAIREKNPGVVMFSASMLGRGGPYDAQPGYGPVLTALSGLTNGTGWPDRVPVSPYGAYTDFLVPHLAIAAISAALEYRRRTGEGQHIDVSQLEASLYYAGVPLLDHAANGRVAQRDGNADPDMAPHAAYPCKGEERWVTIACPDDAAFAALMLLIQRPGLAADPRFETVAGRKAHEGELDAAIAVWTATRTPAEVMAACARAGVPAGAVNDPRDLFVDPQLAHREHFVWLEHPEMGRYAADGNAFTLSGTPPEYRPAPMLGQHTEHVLRELWGVSEERYRALRDAGVLE